MKFHRCILLCLAFVLLILSCATTNNTANKTVPEPELFPYEGQLLHIFFHALVARPETAFKSKDKDHFLDWYVTADEYKKILQALYDSNYVLIDINEVYEVISTNNVKRVVYKKPHVPEGKHPLIISIDDLSYHKNVRENASVHKLVIDDKGGIAAWTDDRKSASTGGGLSYDLDVVTYLEEFIKKHPDFSVRGARGIIALTGFEGVLGYATHKLNDPGYGEEKQKAVAVANKLKELGWRFASHSWGHPNLPEISMAWFINDTNRWDREVRPILGDTNLYVYPFGADVESIEEKHKILRDRNFIVFFGVGSGRLHREHHQHIYFSRRNIDGVYFRLFRNRADRLFNIDYVIDPLRPAR